MRAAVPEPEVLSGEAAGTATSSGSTIRRPRSPAGCIGRASRACPTTPTRATYRESHLARHARSGCGFLVVYSDRRVSDVAGAQGWEHHAQVCATRTSATSTSRAVGEDRHHAGGHHARHRVRAAGVLQRRERRHRAEPRGARQRLHRAAHGEAAAAARAARHGIGRWATPTYLLLDADITAYWFAFIGQDSIKWDERDTSTFHTKELKEVCAEADAKIAEFKAFLEADEVIVCLSCPSEDGWRASCCRPTRRTERRSRSTWLREGSPGARATARSRSQRSKPTTSSASCRRTPRCSPGERSSCPPTRT
jgi:hypothetical protein